MRTQIKGRNVTVTPALNEYAGGKLEGIHKLLRQRHVDEVTQVELELKVEKNPSIAKPCIAEATVFTRGPVIRASESASDMYAAIDLVMDKLTRRVRKYHDKTHRKTRRGHEKPVFDDSLVTDFPATPEEVVEVEQPAAEEDGRVVKRKQFDLKPMSIDEATLQLELVGHDFFVFTNADSGCINVLYCRSDGHYGLIEPSQQ